ncbi:MAG TPA: UvrD-helicase domain-containing protein [Bacteroidales bacterium]|nr:UvrD-helicase domain-containing protein [Bacteroidales bacterium]
MGNQLLVYKSSAGSGKTTQIVIEYLNLVIPSPEKYRNILAITFTNKAAEEMKSRIVKVLQGISAEGIEPYGIFVKQLLNQGISETKVKDNAGIVLKQILHDYSNFAVSTIDSLMHRIIRSFSYDLKLSQRFEVLLDQEELIRKSVDIILDSLQPKEKLTHFLVDFVKSRTDESQSWHIERALYDFAKVLQQDETIDFIPDLKKHSLDDYMKAEKDIKGFVMQFESFLDKKAKEAFEKIGDISPKSFYQGEKGIYSYFKKIAGKKYRGSDGAAALHPGSYAQKFIDEGKYFAAKVPDDDKERIDSIAATLISIHHDIESYVQKEAEQYFFFRLLMKNLHGLAVLKEIEEHLSKLKDEKDVIHISEFNRRISQQIQANASVPFIYERIGEKYLHCFVDEFQDTSVLQWHNLLPLITNGLAAGNQNMLVGDAKQSIYRWRGGEVEQFAILPRLFQKERLADGDVNENLITSQFNEKYLEVNYRTSKTIVEFNNDLFGFIASNSNDKVKSIFDHHHQKPFRDDFGLVAAEFVDGKGEELEEAHLDAVKRYVDESLQAGYQKKDIAVLVRTKQKGMSLASFLSEHNYPVISSDSLLLSSAPKLHFLMALFKLILNPDDDVAWLEAKTFLYYHHKIKDAFHDFIRENEGNGKAKKGPQFLKKWLRMDTDQWENYSLYDLAEQLIRQFGLEKSGDPFITFFLEEVHKQSLDSESGLSDFIDWWELNKNKKSIVAPEGIDAIRIYTVHKSKGLEFPVVIVPFITKNAISPTNSSLWLQGKHHFSETSQIPVAYVPANKSLLNTAYADEYEQEMARSMLDEVNVLYVALTRPQQRLYLSADLPSRNSRSQSMALFLSEFFLSKGHEVRAAQRITLEGGDDKQKASGVKAPFTEAKRAMVSESWRKKIVIASQAEELHDISLGRLEGRYWGELMHSALADIDKSSDFEEVISRFKNEALLSASQVEHLAKTVKQVIEHPKLKELFSGEGQVFTERDIITSAGEVVRPDRVVVKNNIASLVEYKTGKKQDPHKEQVEKYAQSLQQAGYEVNQKYLVYLDEEPEVVTIMQA